MANLEKNIPYAPYIDSTLSAFQPGESFTIPYKHNPAINSKDIKGFCLRLRQAYDNSKINDELDNITTDNYNNTFITFKKIPENENLKLGQFYKIQIAYIDKNGIIGTFSQIAVVKCAKAGTVEIINYDLYKVNEKKRKLFGLYTPDSKDAYEKEQSYCFKLLEPDSQEVLDYTGWIKHNATENDGQDVYNFSIDLEEDKIYFLIYEIQTLNSLTASVLYRVISSVSVTPYYENLGIITEFDEDNGCVNLTLNNGKDETFEGKGTFSISRSEKESNIWSEIKVISNEVECQDFLIEYGKTYKYRVQQINKNGVYSRPSVASKEITAYFQHSYLFDGKRQLNIGYNGNISSLKNNVLESKIDTIGSTYPFLFRNGMVQYKEFPLSSLLSLVTDNQKYFSTAVKHTTKVKGMHNTSSVEVEVDITKADSDIYQYNEKKFKLAALDWLSNGEVKLLKTPTEGNFLVRLMSVSLSPENGLNRLLHNFSATAYEIAEYSIENLQNYNFIETTEEKIKELTSVGSSWKINAMATIEVKNGKMTDEGKIEVICDYMDAERNIKFISATQLTPGTKINFNGKENNTYTIGATGRLQTEVDFKGINKITIITDAEGGTLDYIYTKTILSDFDQIKNYTVYQVPLVTFAGQGFILLDVIIGKEIEEALDIKEIFGIKEVLFDEKKKQLDKWLYLGFKDRRKTAIKSNETVINSTFPEGLTLKGYQERQELVECNGDYYRVFDCLIEGSTEIKTYYKKINAKVPKIQIDKKEKLLDNTTKYIALVGDELKIKEINVNELVSIDCGFQYIELQYEDDFSSEATGIQYNYEYKNWLKKTFKEGNGE